MDKKKCELFIALRSHVYGEEFVFVNFEQKIVAFITCPLNKTGKHFEHALEYMQPTVR